VHIRVTLAAVRVVGFVLVAGCNSLLGIHDFHAPTADDAGVDTSPAGDAGTADAGPAPCYTADFGSDWTLVGTNATVDAMFSTADQVVLLQAANQGSSSIASATDALAAAESRMPILPGGWVEVRIGPVVGTAWQAAVVAGQPGNPDVRVEITADTSGTITSEFDEPIGPHPGGTTGSGSGASYVRIVFGSDADQTEWSADDVTWTVLQSATTTDAWGGAQDTFDFSLVLSQNGGATLGSATFSDFAIQCTP
jgi:hypothetical protein